MKRQLLALDTYTIIPGSKVEKLYDISLYNVIEVVFKTTGSLTGTINYVIGLTYDSDFTYGTSYLYEVASGTFLADKDVHIPVASVYDSNLVNSLNYLYVRIESVDGSDNILTIIGGAK